MPFTFSGEKVPAGRMRVFYPTHQSRCARQLLPGEAENNMPTRRMMVSNKSPRQSRCACHFTRPFGRVQGKKSIVSKGLTTEPYISRDLSTKINYIVSGDTLSSGGYARKKEKPTLSLLNYLFIGNTERNVNRRSIFSRRLQMA